MDEREQFQFPATRGGLTRKFQCGLDVYLTVNLKPNGELGELFVKLGKPGSTVSGLIQAWVLTISAALQRGVAWRDLSEKYAETRFEPNTHQYASLVDAVARNVDDMIVELRHRLGDRVGQLTFDFDENE